MRHVKRQRLANGQRVSEQEGAEQVQEEEEEAPVQEEEQDEEETAKLEALSGFETSLLQEGEGEGEGVAIFVAFLIVCCICLTGRYIRPRKRI